jgi:hypothetical protein
LLAEKWQYRQFIFSVSTWIVWRNATGCTGLLPSDEEAPLYAESMVASAAMHMNPGTASHLLRKFIRDLFVKAS